MASVPLARGISTRLAQHVLVRRNVRSQMQSTRCHLCGREFTTVTACRRHIHRQSCGSSCCNYGQAGAIAGSAATTQTRNA